MCVRERYREGERHTERERVRVCVERERVCVGRRESVCA